MFPDFVMDLKAFLKEKYDYKYKFRQANLFPWWCISQKNGLRFRWYGGDSGPLHTRAVI